MSDERERDRYLTVVVTVISRKSIEHKIQVSALEYEEWLDGRPSNDFLMRAFLRSDEEWYERFGTATFVDEEEDGYEIDEAEVLR